MSILISICSIYGSIPLFLKAHAQQRNMEISTDGHEGQSSQNNSDLSPYLSLTLQTIKNPGGQSSAGDEYVPKGSSILAQINDSGEEKTERFALNNSTSNKVVVSNISIFPTISFTGSDKVRPNMQDSDEISRVFIVNNITKQEDGQLYQGISKFIPITINNKVYPEPIASFYQYSNGTGTLNIIDQNPPIQTH